MTSFTTRDALNQELSEGQHFRPISVRFKKVFTTNVKYYMINPAYMGHSNKSTLRSLINDYNEIKETIALRPVKKSKK
jgi:hypothetical protein